MRLTRVYIPPDTGRLHAGADVTVPQAAAEHITRVLRLRVGANLIAFDGRGGEWQAQVGSIARGRVTLKCLVHDAVERESNLHITLLQSLARGEKMDWVIQKASELGVQRIIPVSALRSVVQIDESRAATRLLHWRAVAASACEQCGRNRLPDILAPMSMAEACAADLPETRLVLAPGVARTLALALGSVAAVTCLIGPEGGITSEELTALQHSGFHAVSLGSRILRTETAAIAAIAALQLLRGDLAAC